MLLRTPIDLGVAIRERRRQIKLDQDGLAKRVGVSRKWIIDVEKGKPRAEVGLILRTLDLLGLRLSLDAPRDENQAPIISAPDIDKVLDRTRDRRS